ncbi:MAG: hypothetical protein OZ921_03335 [Sorangiineae bacterium]|nr:hypothetical protein [Polyangiaceae bacterium]MEB2321522.1 hypothetical protein [Sorangiineae bacterium]
MSESELFKYDVRVRERLMRKGQLSEAEVRAHLDALPDSVSNSEVVASAQPAVGRPEEHARAARMRDLRGPLTPPLARPPAAPPVAMSFEDDDDDDGGDDALEASAADDDDDSDDDDDALPDESDTSEDKDSEEEDS